MLSNSIYSPSTISASVSTLFLIKTSIALSINISSASTNNTHLPRMYFNAMFLASATPSFFLFIIYTFSFFAYLFKILADSSVDPSLTNTTQYEYPVSCTSNDSIQSSKYSAALYTGTIIIKSYSGLISISCLKRGVC